MRYLVSEIIFQVEQYVILLANIFFNAMSIGFQCKIKKTGLDTCPCQFGFTVATIQKHLVL